MNQPLGERACQLAGKTLDFLGEQAGKIPENELWIGSSEILESLFGKLKHLEQDQSSSGFTTLVLAIPACLGKLDSDTVMHALTTTRNQDELDWGQQNLGMTLQAKRRQALKADPSFTQRFLKVSGQEKGGFYEENLVKTG